MTIQNINLFWLINWFDWLIDRLIDWSMCGWIDAELRLIRPPCWTLSKRYRTRRGGVVDVSAFLDHIWCSQDLDLWPFDVVLRKVAEPPVTNPNLFKNAFCFRDYRVHKIVILLNAFLENVFCTRPWPLNSRNSNLIGL